MIPKVIHYCWFGGNPLPETAQKCIASWKKYCPDYEIKEWNETNIDISSVDYMKEAYEEKAWGFVSDVARLQIIYEHGGIYMDTDVEIVKSLDVLLNNSAFFGMEDSSRNIPYVASGLGFGAEKGNDLIGKILSDYQNRSFRKDNGILDKTPSPVIQTSLLKGKGFQQKNVLQIIDNAYIYPTEYFSPLSLKTGKLHMTENTYSIHHYSGSWLTESEKNLTKKRHQIFQRYGYFAFPIWCFVWMQNKIYNNGVKEMLKIIVKKIKL